MVKIVKSIHFPELLFFFFLPCFMKSSSIEKIEFHSSVFYRRRYRPSLHFWKRISEEEEERRGEEEGSRGVRVVHHSLKRRNAR